MCDSEKSAEPARHELIDTLRLAMVPGVGPRIRQALLERFGSPRAVLTASREMLLGVQGVGPKISRAVADADRIDVDRVIDLCRKHGIDILAEPDDCYPRMLREIHDPPGVLFVGGSLKPDDALAVGIVGTRHATA